MSEGGLTVLDGTHLIAADLSLPESNATVTGAELLQLAESRVSSLLFGLSLPENLASAALKRLGVDDAESFRRTEFASSKLKDFITAIADELKDEPLVVAILDGKPLEVFLEDEDDFAMLAENLFTDLDTKETGKISKNEIRNALVQMGVEMGIPPFSEFPQLNEILLKHGAEGAEELGQSQFAELLQSVLQELADALAKKHVVVIQNIKIINGSKLRKLLGSEDQLHTVVEKIFQQLKNSQSDAKKTCDTVRAYLEENAVNLGLPSPKADESVALLYDIIFAAAYGPIPATLEKNDVELLVKKILENFAVQLEASPVFQDNED